MNMKLTHFKKWPALSALATLFWFPASARAQTMPAQKSDDSSGAAQDRDPNRQEPARFDQFLDSHREIAEQVRKDPSLLNNKEFVKNHPALQSYLQEHPGIRSEIKQDPSAFMHQEDRYDMNRGDRYGTPQEMARFDQFLDNHREISQQLRKNPSLVNDQQYLKDHPALQTYLQEHPTVRREITQNPNAFMQAEQRYDQRDNDVNRDRDRDAEHNNVARSDHTTNQNNNTGTAANVNQNQSNDADRARTDRDADRNTSANRRTDADRYDRGSDQERARFDQFLDSHRETAEQIRKDPSLANNPKFLKDHPALQTYLQDHPATRSEIKNDPNGFMQQQDRFERDRAQSAGQYGRYDNDMMRNDRDRDRTFTHSGNFGEFLNAHTRLAQQLSKDPSLVKNQEYMKDHPELQSYLDAHPEVKQELMQNPQGFVKSAQQTQPFNNGQMNNNGQAAKPPSTPDPSKPKQ
jgi:hypothetical protein